MSELKPCPLCGAMPEKLRTGYMCSTLGCALQENTVSEKEWNTRPIEDALNNRIAELEGIIKSDDERLTEAGLKVNVYFGCDTAEIMAEEILSSRARIAELEAENEKMKKRVTELAWTDRPAVLFDLKARIAELEAMVKGHDPFEEFPPKERGFECSVVVLGKFEYEDEFNPITNWDLCVYWFDEERWHPLNGYLKGDDIVKWYSLPEELEAESERFTVHSDIERQDDNYSNHTQTDAVVYGKWIPVSEGLPEDCERVWVRATNSPQNLPRRAFHTYRNGKWVNDEVDIDNVYSNLNVTHWMPLPEPPEEQE